jgi:ABC-2 type transport system permease protein
VLLLRHGSLFLGSGDTARALALAVLAIALWGVLGLGVGTLIRNQVVALLVSIGVAWIAEPLLAFGLDAAHLGAVARYLPSQATSAVISPATTNSGVDVALLPWWGGALVVIGYAVLSGGLGALFTLRRDVT